MVTLSLPTRYGQKSWDTLAFLGRFPIRTGPTLPLTPQTKLDALIQNFFRVSALYRMGAREGELQENFEKGLLFYEGTKKLQKNMNTALLYQGLLSMIVAVEHCIPFNCKCAVL